ncbi:MAG TPA: kelch repeat-containing protein [Saprospiraceae bacterium]|nr:kelch repeat-containing protein [Saprospiraceae bacterium]
MLGLERGILEQVGHCWSNNNTSLTLEQVTHTSLPGDVAAPDGSFESVLEGLSADTVYFLRAYAIYLSQGRRDTVYETGFKNFTPVPLNIIATSIRLEDVNVRVTSAITGLAQNTATAFGHCWSNQTETPRVGDGVSKYSDFGILDRDSVFEDYLPGLQLAKTYYVRAYVTTGGKTFYSNVLSIFVGDKWVQRADFPKYVIDPVGFCLDEKIYIGLGRDLTVWEETYENRFWRYDPQTNIWAQVADFPGIPRRAAESFVVAGKAYVGFGIGKSNTISPSNIYAYSAEQNAWVEKASFPGDGRFSASAFSIGNKGYISCGHSANGSLNETWCYDPLDVSNGKDVNGDPMGRWVRKSDFAGSPRTNAIAFAIAGKGYLGTGLTVTPNVGPTAYFNDFWEYDPADSSTGLDDTGQPKGRWVQRADCGTINRYESLGYSIGDFGYVIGGRSNGFGFLHDCWRYNPKTDRWTLVNSIPDGNEIHDSDGVAVSSASRGYVFNPVGGFGVFLNTFWENIPFQ